MEPAGNRPEMTLRGIVKYSTKGSVSRNPGHPWMLSIVLHPWRNAAGQLEQGTAGRNSRRTGSGSRKPPESRRRH